MLNSACNEWHRILSIYFYISVYITICIYTYRISLYWYTLVYSCMRTVYVHTCASVISLTDSNGTWHCVQRIITLAWLSPVSVDRNKFQCVSKWFYFRHPIICSRRECLRCLSLWLQVQDHVAFFVCFLFLDSWILTKAFLIHEI